MVVPYLSLIDGIARGAGAASWRGLLRYHCWARPDDRGVTMASIARTTRCLVLALVSVASAQELAETGYSPYAGREYPTRVYWGDTHLHTRLSMDAGAMGTLATPDDAYRFARGEEVISTSGVPARLSRPLDFLVIADHSDAMGTMMEIIKGNPFFATDPIVRRWIELIASGDSDQRLIAAYEIVAAFGVGENLPPVLLDRKFARGIWDDYTAVADRYYDPGRFTTLIGYEWTSMPDWNNLHRVVIYRDGAKTARRMLPALVADGMDPEQLWAWLERYERETGGDVLAIPHNGNISEGLMFAEQRYDGSALTSKYAEIRNRWEPLYETTQVKGDSEAHPLLSPNDEFADYETWDDGNFLYDGAAPETLPGDYARSGLKRGLELERRLGINPYKFGLIGSTDAHTGLATAAEDNYFGKFVQWEPRPERWRPWTPTAKRSGWEYVASGLAAVWARDNTREAIFDAMERREAYASTGPRITLRFFGGWDFATGDANARHPAEIGYRKGVPMGGDLTRGPAGKAPSFLVAAVRDPYSGNLDRIQIIKGWLDRRGQAQEQVYDVVWSGKRTIGRNGKLPAVGNTIDSTGATWSNTIGAAKLITVWRDPDFDPARRAFYYVRVIEIPTPRWTAHDAGYFGGEVSSEVPMTVRERAYSSPIWYTP